MDGNESLYLYKMEDLIQKYFGLIKIVNKQHAVILKPDSDREPVKVHLVHYQDCQQMVLWLPENFRFYDSISIKDLNTSVIIFEKRISDIINGTIQIILDTLFIYPGDFEITIKKTDGLNHQIFFTKYSEEATQENIESPITDQIKPDKGPIIYRDGFGNEIPNEDLILRDKLIQKTLNKIFRSLSYISHGREGEVVYREGEKTIRFYMEMGGGNCVFYLNIPSIAEWENATKFPLAEREDIITFVAEQTQRDQASGCRYKILEQFVQYYMK